MKRCCFCHLSRVYDHQPDRTCVKILEPEGLPPWPPNGESIITFHPTRSNASFDKVIARGGLTGELLDDVAWFHILALGEGQCAVDHSLEGCSWGLENVDGGPISLCTAQVLLTNSSAAYR